MRVCLFGVVTLCGGIGPIDDGDGFVVYWFPMGIIPVAVCAGDNTDTRDNRGKILVKDVVFHERHPLVVNSIYMCILSGWVNNGDMLPIFDISILGGDVGVCSVVPELARGPIDHLVVGREYRRMHDAVCRTVGPCKGMRATVSAGANKFATLRHSI